MNEKKSGNDISAIGQDDPINLNDYILQNKIGSGGFGKVYKVKNKKTRKDFAAKISFLTIENNTEEIENLFREINIISKLDHPSVLKFIGYSPVNFKNKPKPVIITELATNGSLDELIQIKDISKEFYNDTLKLMIIYGIASAMSYLHFHNILHRDLKPANILLDAYSLPKIADFGLSKVYHQNKESITTGSTNGFKGTPVYMSPEIWFKNEYSKASDVYAFSLIVYEIMTNEKPFEDSHFWDIPSKLRNGYRPPINDDVPESYRNLIQQCWAQNPSDRPSFYAILDQLQFDKGFITKNVNEKNYRNYIKYINEYNTSFDSSKTNISIDTFLNWEKHIFKIPRNQTKPALIKIQEESFDSRAFKFKTMCDIQRNDYKRIMGEAYKNPEKQFEAAKCFIEAKFFVFQYTSVGILYLKQAYKNGFNKALAYYCIMMIKGNLIPKNNKKVKKLIEERLKGKDDSLYFFINGKMLKSEKKYSEAMNQFLKSDESEAIYEVGKMYLKGQGFPVDKEKAIEYFEKAIEKGSPKAMYKYGMLLKEEENKEHEGIQHIKNAADIGYPKALYQYYLILMNIEQSQSDESVKIKYLKDAAYSGHTEAMYQYGLYLYNLRDNKYVKEFFIFFEKASQKGHIKALYKYGDILSTKNSFHYSLKKAARCFRIAAILGDADAMVKYGLALVNGEGVQVDVDEAIKYFKIAADKGNIDACNFYGVQLHKRENKTPEEAKEALKYITIAANNGNELALGNLGSFYEYGIYTEKNDEMAAKYYKMSIANGNSRAMYDYATFLLEGDKADENREEAIKYLEMAIEKGEAAALNDYGLMLFNGDGVPMDRQKGYEYLTSAAELGNAAAMVNLGIFYSDGIGVSQDKEIAAHYFKMAADKDSVEGYLNYGIHLETGHGVEMDKKEAIKYFKKAIEKGNAQAMNNYAHMLLHGNGVESNPQQAVKLFKMAIEKGNLDAMLNYADMLINGIGIEEDRIESLKYYKMAAEKGDSDSMIIYGISFFNGMQEINEEEGLKYIKMAEEKGNAHAPEAYKLIQMKLNQLHPKEKTEDTIKHLELSLVYLYFGIQIKFSNTRRIICTGCQCAGTKDGQIPDKCDVCNGSGVIKENEKTTKCENCLGTGKLINDDNICPMCDGEGFLTQKFTVDLKIPSGTKDGDEFRIRGYSNELPNHDTGDLLVVIQEDPNETYKRKLNDLITVHEISLCDALCGARFTLEHLSGQTLLVETDPNEIIEPGAVHVIKGGGMPVRGSKSEYGDLYIIYKIIFPKREQLTDEFREEMNKVIPIIDKAKNVDINANDVSIVTPKFPEDFD